MARALVIEEESGTFRGRAHRHNGYYAGDFPTTGPVVGARDAASVQVTRAGGSS
jgi:hypothetical protein